jgi:hypothetical protein
MSCHNHKAPVASDLPEAREACDTQDALCVWQRTHNFESTLVILLYILSIPSQKKQISNQYNILNEETGVSAETSAGNQLQDRPIRNFVIW